MVGRIALIAVVTLLSLYVALPTSAQEESAQGVRRSPLGERLQRFRNELFGEMPRRGATAPRAARKQAGPPQPVVELPDEAELQAEEVEMPPARRSEAMAAPSVKVPSYLEKQGARRAQGGRSAAPVDGATRSLRARMAPIHRPAEEARSEFADPDAEHPEPQVEQSPFELENDLEAPGEPSPAEPERPQAGASDDSVQRYDDVQPEGAEEREPRVARSLPEAIDRDALDQEIVEDPAMTGSLDEPEPSLDAPTEPLDQGADSLDAPAESLDERTESLPESAESLDDDRARSLEEGAESLDKRVESLDERGSSDVLFTSQSPVLSVQATGPRTVLIGKEAEFVVKVRNTGAAANNVVISINIPSYADVAGAQSTAGSAQPAAGAEQHEGLAWTIDRLEAGSSETLALKLVPRKSAPMDLAVTWTFTPETSQTMVEVQEPKLAMTLSGPTEVLYGQTKIYKLTISNPGNGDCENVSIGLAPVGRSGEASASHRLGTLAAGESKTIDIELTARQAGAVTIKAHAFADGGLRAEAAEQVLVRRASLQVEVEAPRVKYAGTDGAYRVKVENVGDATAENVHVSAILPPEAKFIGASSGGRLKSDQAQVDWAVGSLQPGGQRVYELQCALCAPGDNRLQFTAAADGDLSAAATSNTRVEAIADLKLEVADPKGPIAVGDETIYEVRIRNRGTKAAEGVDLAIFFSEGLEATSADGGPHDIGSGQVVFKPIASLAAGGTAVFHIHSRAETSGNHVFRAEVTCESLQTKLASEEATHFYGEPRTAVVRKGEPRVATAPGEPHLAAPPEDQPTGAPAEHGDPPSDQPPPE
ncbi:MAG: CARDB domain-containing protein [Pirellulales bacterium]